MAEQSNLDLWLTVSSIAPIDLGISFFDLDPFWLHALTVTVNNYSKKQREESQKAEQKLERTLEDLKPKGSLMAGMPRPSFNQI